MEETCKENLIKNNKKNLLSSFYSITEKQDESSSNYSINEMKFNKQIITDNSSSKHFLNKKEIENNNLKKYKYKKKTSKSLNKLIKEKENSNNGNSEKEKINKFIRKGSKGSKTKLNDIRKTISIKQNLSNLFLKQIKNSDNMFKKQNSFNYDYFSNKGIIKLKKNLSTSNFNNNYKLLNYRTIIRSKSLNISSSNGSFIQLYNIKDKNDTIIRRQKIIQFNDHDKSLKINLFEKLKDTPMFEKTEKTIHKVRIYNGILIFFSIMSILFQIIDSVLYNSKSMEFLEEENNNKSLIYLNDYNYFYILEKRKISIQENYIRVFNIIFSIICVTLLLIIYIIKNKIIKQTNKNNKIFYDNYSYFDHNKKKKYIKDDRHINIIPNKDIISKKKLPRSEVIKIVISCIINLICCPPSYNKVYIKIKKDIVLVYTLNNLFLIFTMFKIINIYVALVHLSPLNKLIYKTICSSNMVKMDFLFMVRFFLNRYPITFIVINFLIFGTFFCILIYSSEFFSLDIKKGYWNNKGNNSLKNYRNTIYLFLFYIVKNEYGDIKPKSEVGFFIIIILGTFGLLAISYFVYYTSELIQFSTEEQKAYQKLCKLLNPLNKEHKSANLIKIFILTKKIYNDNKNIENDYITNKLKIKRKKSNKKSYKRTIFNFGLDDSDIYNNTYSLFSEDNKDKKNFINYLCQKFIIKLKLISELNNVNNNYIIARNFSHSFNNFLKTLGRKMNDNLNQLNNKLQIIISKDEKYKDFMKFLKNNLKKILKINKYQNAIIFYLINKHNIDNYEDYISLKRKIKKSKGDFSGTVLYLHKKLIKKKLKKFAYIKSPRKIRLNKVKSLVIGLNGLSNYGHNLNYKKKDNKYNNEYKIIKERKEKKSKSLDYIILNDKNIITKFFLFNNINTNKNKIRNNTYDFNKDKIIDNIRFDDESS